MGQLWQRLQSYEARRVVDAVEGVASVLLAICFAYWLGAGQIAWAAFAGYMVLRGHVRDTLSRAVLRVTGTIAGGALALLLVPATQGHWLADILLLFGIGTLSLYGALVTRRAYAWLFFGLTFVMVLLDQNSQPQLALSSFVELRVLETLAGTLACVIVSILSALTLRRWWPASPSPQASSPGGWHPHAARHAAQGGLALAMLALLGHLVTLPALSHGAITIMAVMIIPATGIGASGLIPVSRRILHRVIGCLAGAAYAFVVLLLMQGHVDGLILGTVAGVLIGKHIESGNPSLRYIGTQFALAMLLVLVPDDYAQISEHPALERLTGIFIGMAVLEPVLLLGYLRGLVRR